ncbi:ADP-ribosylarginine hydrolase Tri1-like [Asterias amurensis]|uniref:ADP-ribosylarginine hydrolase Tri1-like n=1 Tax=Asterias amurensis TaxID=7602 RepID=UPI003AB8E2E8
MGKAQSYLKGKVSTLGRDKSNDDKLTLIVDPSNILQDQILGTVYGNCIGDAIGLMTEFLNKEQACKYYSGKHLEYSMKAITAEHFFHQMVFPEADWTDDSDQMILILQSLMENDGQAVATDFAEKLVTWRCSGFPELGDTCGMGLGRTTGQVLRSDNFKTDPHKVAETVWENGSRFVAPNGGVMRTSIAGVHRFDDIQQVISNTKVFCKVTHADPRCVASCVAVTTAIAMMLQGMHRKSNGSYKVDSLIEAAFDYAKECLLRDDEGNLKERQVEELKFHMNASLPELKLDDRQRIGYTFKCLGAGFWALRQKNFREAIEAITLEGGDADTNGAVAGALLGCKLGYKKIPPTWRNELTHKKWLDDILVRYFEMGIKSEGSGTPVDAPQSESILKAAESSETDNIENQAQHSEGKTSDGTNSVPSLPSAEVKDQSSDVKTEPNADTQQGGSSEVELQNESSKVTDQIEVKGQVDLVGDDPQIDGGAKRKLEETS